MRLRTILSLGLVGFLVLAGCGDDDSPTDPGGDVTVVSTLHQGTYAAESGDAGSALLLLHTVGTEVFAEFILHPRSGIGREWWIPLRGARRGDSLDLVLAAGDVVAPGTRFVGEWLPGGVEAGFTFPDHGLEGTTTLTTLPLGRTVVLEAMADLGTPRGVVHDGEHAWVSRFADYARLDSGRVDTTLRVFRPGLPSASMSSSEFAEDGGRFWGQIPLTIQDPDTTRSVSYLYEFDAEGFRREAVLDHRCTALAARDGQLWSVPLERDRLLRIDEFGTRLGSLPLEAPDVVALDHDGTDFWGLGWYGALLYRIDGTGRTREAWLLPRLDDALQPFPTGIAWDGNSAWYVTSDPGPAPATLFRLRLEPTDPGGAVRWEGAGPAAHPGVRTSWRSRECGDVPSSPR